MSTFGLADYLKRNPNNREDGSCALWDVNNSHYTPGFWVSLAALARSKGVKYDQIRFIDQQHKEYSDAIRLQHALGENDSYPHDRRNEGRYYSGLVLLENYESTDRATKDVNSCIRHLCQGLEVDQFVLALCETVGDLHDNIWSHGMSTGFSMAQRWKKPQSCNDFLFEFALADCGLGFLREMRRVGLEVANDGEAIEWCIQRGNSSKLVNKKTDSWAQSLPADMIGNPIKGIGKIKDPDNHHQGLGLAKLISLVSDYRGELWLSSGDAIFVINFNGERSFLPQPSFSWPGVAIACRFDTSLVRPTLKVEELDDVTNMLIDYLGGDDENDTGMSSRD